jgi:hypothetical protein
VGDEVDLVMVLWWSKGVDDEIQMEVDVSDTGYI